jgi:hypothetical protein
VPFHTPQIGLYALWDNRFPRRVDMEGRVPPAYG